MTLSARLYIGVVVTAGCAIMASTLAGLHPDNLVRFATYIVLAGLSGGLKIRLPGVTGTHSGGFLIVLLAVAQLSTPETVLIAIVSVLVQYAWHSTKRLRLSQASFNICNVAIAALVASSVLHSPMLQQAGIEHPLRLGAAAVLYFISNSTIVAVIIALTENKSIQLVVREYYIWSLPFYLVAAAVVEGIGQLERIVGWETSVLAVPAVYALYQVWSIYADRVEGERKRQAEARVHAEEMSALHVRTIHALAMAIEARDRTTHDHLRRVQIYAVELGREMGLSEVELEALRTAAVLHDIGKLGVPEHIISKPGRLTPDEFQKVQAHPVIGAEILERVNFPYGVVPIVRCHHERYDGSGYPSGLKGKEIPIGARILAVVDCFDALASDRQYRKAMSTDQAMDVIRKAAGRDFDPEIVNLLLERFAELEVKVRNTASIEPPMLSREEIRKAVPAAGFQTAIVSAKSYDGMELARCASQLLDRPNGNLIHFGEVLASVDWRLSRELRFDVMAVYVRDAERIRLRYITGHINADKAAEDWSIKLGEGLSGWVVEEGRPILNGNGKLDLVTKNATGNEDLVTASSVPLQWGDRTVGALTVYSKERDGFSARDLQVLWGVSADIGVRLMEERLAESTQAAPVVHAHAKAS